MLASIAWEPNIFIYFAGTLGDISPVDSSKEPFFSRKLLRLIGILSNFRLQPSMKCIIFVNRIVIARSLTYILQNLKFLSSWKCDFLVGIHSGLVSRKNTDAILQKFHSGELNLLVATKVGEEGLDIQTCCLVIRFDLPETVASFIQSRGRARMPQSEYAFLVDRNNPRELDLIEHFKKDEDRMNEEISSRTSHVIPTDFEERTYRVDITGATISSVSSIALLHHYCSKLPHDEYFKPKPQFFYYDDADGVVCKILLPANSPIHEIVSAPQSSKESSKRDACLKACKELHEVGAFTDYLLPDQDAKNDQMTQDSSDSDSCDDENSRVELHEMLVPASLRGPWKKVCNSTYFSSYYVKFSPNPVDRIYRKFGLFVKEPLPQEAGNMQLDLCLARGRMVTTKFIPSGEAIFSEDEVTSAEKFQQMFLNIILDRSKFIPEYFSLEENDVHEANTSTFYLLLPIVQYDDKKIFVDWMLVNRCLSSPIFRHQEDVVNDDIPQTNCRLHLSNGVKDVHDIVDSLVYVPRKETFFFISEICHGKNGYSLYDKSKTHVEHYIEVFDIHLAHPYQPLLKAKQLFVLDNLLRKKKTSEEWREKEEHFIELPPEICQLKIIGFSRDIGSSLSLLPSIMCRLESFLVAIELKEKLFSSFPEAAEVTADRILEALTTERCGERFSLERLEVLGDAFLKFAVGRHLFLEHDALDEGQLTRKRSNIVKNYNLHKLATRSNLQVYIRDQSFEPNQFFTLGRPCPITCKKETEKIIHFRISDKVNGANAEVRCNKGHHWLHKKVIADVVEALIGAFIVDSGFKAATAFLSWVGIQVDFSPSQIQNICSASAAFLSLADQIDVNTLENLLGYKFCQKGLLIQAFIHPSFNNDLGGCYQRLEFLGDAVLDYLITSYLYSVYPNLKPGQLTDLRSASVNNISFADVAGRWSLHKFILCDSSPLREAITAYLNSTRTSSSAKGHIEELTCPKALGDVVESCVGALFLDAGFDLNRVWKIVYSLLDPIVTLSKLQFNPLRDLRELCQFHNWKLLFSSVKKDGKFSVEAKVDEKKVTATSCATNAQGYRSKSKSLEEVLSKCEKREAKLIGYEETSPVEFVKSGKMKIQESPLGDRDVKLSPLSEASTSKCDIVSSPLRQTSNLNTTSELHVTQIIHNNGGNVESPPSCLNNNSVLDPQGTGSICNGVAKSGLYEMCAANCWKPPVFECCNETGPSHSKQFVYKIVLNIEEMPEETFEFYGEPRTRKKDAAESAAQGAIWFLKCQGYLWDLKRNK
ncbi:dicer-like protein 4 [Dorcoceras hygrometricum]|uniref:Dicer-like protein 4 n=1 Tax=Dorcoceras hygrometricum TaxID=472368 RepID=A0A2Z7B9G4_9LAMI|nr:dicer-like protein 4 [Dorcoceras hygrometricum]